ncbi:hypothetical protein O9G_003645 [Rozella allomycis CSF55]|uniref:Uncharacterized protein n=1 Tax=Rozella allomycis (strain CSF55) TaxID=988480 RepID=A0A075B2I8_ROZAC|nr:hypothetical protein O9G_003645 [Rozella allomycis CSF55]|eukprot:EPZ35156.1 hypothetical protein O9G_003645 [Rozella allomycis CSF55]
MNGSRYEGIENTVSSPTNTAKLKEIKEDLKQGQDKLKEKPVDSPCHLIGLGVGHASHMILKKRYKKRLLVTTY